MFKVMIKAILTARPNHQVQIRPLAYHKMTAALVDKSTMREVTRGDAAYTQFQAVAALYERICLVQQQES